MASRDAGPTELGHHDVSGGDLSAGGKSSTATNVDGKVLVVVKTGSPLKNVPGQER